jgi:hypothetical protein
LSLFAIGTPPFVLLLPGLPGRRAVTFSPLHTELGHRGLGPISVIEPLTITSSCLRVGYGVLDVFVGDAVPSR